MIASPWFCVLALAAAPASGTVSAAAASDEGFESVTDGPTETLPDVVRWVDAKGEVHYTNDPSGVPKGVVTQPVRSARVSEISHHPPRAPTPSSAPSSSPPPPPAASDAPDLPDAEETYWRGRFRDANAAVASLEASLESDRQLARELEPFGLYNGRCAVGAGPYYSGPGPRYGAPGFCGGGWNDLQAARARVRQTEVALARAREDLQELERQASFRSVPREWRR